MTSWVRLDGKNIEAYASIMEYQWDVCKWSVMSRSRVWRSK